MKAILALLISSTCIFAQLLSVRAATTKKVELAWTGGKPGAAVERQAVTKPFEKIGDASADTFADEKIAAYGTYKYRLRAVDGSFSNVVTVGPPPMGVNVVAAVPKGLDPANFGAAASIALDENGDPAVAFVWVDPNGDKNREDTGVYLSHWNRAKYVWNAPVLVEVAGDTRLVALTCDPASKSCAIAYSREGQEGARVSISRDAGATWKSTTVAADVDGTTSSVAIAQKDGHWFLVVTSNRGMRFLSGATQDDASSWRSQTPPSAGGNVQAKASLAVNSAGSAIVAYWVKPEKGDNDQIVLWSPASGEVTPAVDSNQQSCEDPDVKINANGSRREF